MSNKNSIASAAPDGSGHLVPVWLAFAAEPASQKKLNKLAEAMEWEIRIRLPDSAFQGMLAGAGRAIRQDANLLLLTGIPETEPDAGVAPGKKKRRREGMLAGNADLLRATIKGKFAEVGNQLERSIRAALSIARRRAARAIWKHLSRYEEVAEEKVGSYKHPSDNSFGELPYEIQKQIALAALKIAVSEKTLSEKNAAPAAVMIKKNLSEAQAARKLGISPQAVNEHLQKVKKHLPKIIDSQEFPFL
jgi:hypothetical protein